MTNKLKQILLYPNITNIFDQSKSYKETIQLNNSCDFITCFNCSTKKIRSKRNTQWNCDKCNLAYSQDHNNIQIYANIHNIDKDPLYLIKAIHPQTTKTKYVKNESLSSHISIKSVLSKIVPNLFIDKKIFKCPCCKSEYDQVDHGDTWICQPCQTEFVSYGQSLHFTESNTYITKKKLSNF